MSYDESYGPRNPHWTDRGVEWNDPFEWVDILQSAGSQLILNIQEWVDPKTGKVHHDAIR